MKENDLCIAIPTDLRCYQKVANLIEEKDLDVGFFSDIRIVKNDLGQIESVNYYEGMELIKSVVYSGSIVTENRFYKNGMLCGLEEFADDKISLKTFYDKGGGVSSKVEYEYNHQDKIVSIKKFKNNNEYLIKYGYDELGRVNARVFIVNDNTINQQKYRYNILDRIVEYRDSNQTICINQMSPSGELISYTITDKIGNEIVVENLFTRSGYSSTKVTLNGYSTTVKDKNYADNIMLKKPYTSEDDLDLIISRLLKPTETTTTRTNYTDVVRRNSNFLVDENIECKTLPISIRKRILFNISKNENVLQNEKNVV